MLLLLLSGCFFAAPADSVSLVFVQLKLAIVTSRFASGYREWRPCSYVTRVIDILA